MDIKCASYKKWKDEEEFNGRNKALGIRHVTCRECHKPFHKNWYEDNKEEHLANVKAGKEKVRLLAKIYVWDYLSRHPCIESDETDPTVFEFHHRHGKKSEIMGVTF